MTTMKEIGSELMAQAASVQQSKALDAPPSLPPSSPTQKPLLSQKYRETALILSGRITKPIFALASQIPPKQTRFLNQAVESKLFPIYLYGSVGSGKTCAAACCASAWPDPHDVPFRFNGVSLPKRTVVAGVPPLPMFWNFKALMSEINCATINGWRNRLYRELNDCLLLVLDDLGTKELTDAGRDALLDVLTMRQGAPLVVTCNHPPSELGTAIGDERISSRLTAGAMIEFPDNDQRIRTAKVFK